VSGDSARAEPARPRNLEEGRGRIALDDEVEDLRVARGGKQRRERGQEVRTQLGAAPAEPFVRGRERHREHLAARRARGGRAVEDPLERRVPAGGEREIGHRAVEPHVQVHDRRRTEPRERSRVEPRRRRCEARGRVGRQRQDHRVGAQRLAGERDHHSLVIDRHTAHHGGQRERRACARQRAPRRRIVNLCERHRRDPDVRGVGAVEEARAQHARRERERRVRRAHVQRRADQQVPERERRAIAHTTLGEPVAERALVELAIVGVERGESARDLRGAQARGEGKMREPEQARREVRGRGQRMAPDPGARSARRQHRHGEPRLERDQVLDAEPREQAAIGGAAAHEHVLTIVDVQPALLGRERRAAEPSARLEQPDPRARVGARKRGGHTREPATDHRDLRRAGKLRAASRRRAKAISHARPPITKRSAWRSVALRRGRTAREFGSNAARSSAAAVAQPPAT
jgi:hypothetical protein